MHLETTMIISTESPQQLQFGISSSKDGLLAIHNAEKFMLRTEYLWTRLEMGSYTKCHDGKDNKAFDIRIPEFSYGVILAGFSEVTA
uniref:Uncharacterized protein n=1 Tax=Rhizophagus irregularis (strain DAOM 181602 / DAOM 197198 / MUCL 43194) TaxID=747089 RepID=U9SQ88_RHIID